MSLLAALGHRLRAQRTVRGRLAFEALVVVFSAALVALIIMTSGGTLAARLAIDPTEAHLVLALLAAGLGAAAVGLGHTAGRIAGNRRASWLIPALALYSIVIIPSTSLLPGRAEDVSSLPPGTFVAYVAVGVLLVAAIHPPARTGTRSGWLVAGLAVVLDLVVSGAAAAFPGAAAAFASPLPASVAVLCCWVSISTAVVVSGYWAQSPQLWRVGLGFGVIACAHLYRIARPRLLTDVDLGFAALRFLGVAVVLLGMSQLLRRALNLVLAERFSHQEELRLAGVDVERMARAVAERDHELRNGLAGLSGMTQLLGGADDPGRSARSAVASELDRLHRMVGGLAQRSASGLYDVGRVLADLIDLWRAAGLPIEATVGSGLTALGRPATFAQVVTNLLANCSRHAPGSKVQIIARRDGSAVAVQVRDFGPATPCAPVADVPAPDLPGRDTAEVDPAGQGIGLLISERLLEEEGGRLRLVPGDGTRRRGFTAVIHLPTGPGPLRSAGSASAGAQDRPVRAVDR